MEFDVMIVGGGLVGASVARALAGCGLKLALLESAPPPPGSEEWEARIYAFSPATVAFLESIGIWRTMDATRRSPVRTMRVFGDDGRSSLELSSYEAALGELAFIVESGQVQRALWRAIERQPGLTLLCPARPDELKVEPGRATIRTDRGERLSAKLVVGADGANSWVRREGGFDTVVRPYGQRGVVANFACERPHREVAFQWFRPDGVLAWLPLPGNRFSMVWSTPDEHAGELLAVSPEDLCRIVAEAGCGLLGKLDPITPAAAFDLSLVRVKSLVKPRIALVGDAGHVMHPLAGQGVNLGFGDARALAQVLLSPAARRDPGDHSLLRRFERLRAEDILAMRLVTDGLQRLFGMTDRRVARLRNAGLKLTDAVPVLKTLLIRRAVS